MPRHHCPTLRALFAAAILSSGAMLAGCGPTDRTGGAPRTEPADSGAPNGTPEAAAAAGGPLAGTAWRLVEIQSMDDTVGTVSPEDPSLYTMRLDGDGTVTLRLDCNRATGTWSAEPSSDGESGRFELGSLAATRALCPPPSLDEQVAAQAEFVRGYLLRDGRLYLTLMADGGILVWESSDEAQGVRFETERDAGLEAAILHAEPDYTKAIVEIDGRLARYVYGRLDLNGDGRDEVFVYLMGSIFCGTGGCTLLLFTQTETGYALVDTFAISRAPVVVSAETTSGWRDLIREESGGGAPGSYVRHAFDGERYVERQRQLADAAPEGTSVLAGEFTYADGIALEPNTP